jgi:hypothetical protein
VFQEAVSDSGERSHGQPTTSDEACIEASRRASKTSLEVDARPDIGDDPVTGIFTAQEINLPGKITFAG